MSAVDLCLSNTVPPKNKRNPINRKKRSSASIDGRRPELIAWLNNNISPPPADYRYNTNNLAWPNRWAIATFMASVNYATPLGPAVVYYDSDNTLPGDTTPRMNTRLYTVDSQAIGDAQDARLIGPVGYNISYNLDGSVAQCGNQQLPGAIIPKWGARNYCKARATVSGTARELGLSKDAVIFTCAIDTRWFWIWYTKNDTPPLPITFMEAGADITFGTGCR